MNSLETELLAVIAEKRKYIYHVTPGPTDSVSILETHREAEKATLNDFFTVKIPQLMGDLRTKSYVTMEKRWENEWENKKEARHTKMFLPQVSSNRNLKNIFLYHQFTQIITGRCRLNAFQFKIGRIKEELCPCGEEAETIEHHLFHCRLQDSPRAAIKLVCGKLGLQYPPQPEKLVSEMLLLKALMVFSRTSSRLCT